MIEENKLSDDSGVEVESTNQDRHIIKLTFPPFFKIGMNKEGWVNGGVSRIQYTGLLEDALKDAHSLLDFRRRSIRKMDDNYYFNFKLLKERKKNNTLKEENARLLVNLDTLQRTCERAEPLIAEGDRKYVFTDASRWAMNNKS